MNEQQQQEALSLLTGLPWGDFDDAIREMEGCLRLALEATVAAFWMWEEEVEEIRFEDEFSLTPSQVDQLSPEWRLAYVARLLRSLALFYGVGTELGGGPPVGEACPDSPAAISRDLNDVSWISVTALIDEDEAD